ncbi:MAG: DNA-binding MarR family transcriptional regulator [Lysobacterales bacterium]|jgi:DNA-binding MarR family transcriptional regulator
MSVSDIENRSSELLLEKFLPYRLSLLSNTVSQGISAGYKSAYGLSVTEWRVVAILGRFPGLTASEVTQRGAMDKVAVSRAVNKLQSKSLIERSPHQQDRRRLQLKLTTAKGLPLFRKIVPKALAYENQLLEALSKDELCLLDALIQKLQASAEMVNKNNNTK